MHLADPGADIKFRFIYVPAIETSLHFLVSASDQASVGCAWSWNVKAGEMGESLTKTIRSGTINVAANREFPRWRREAVSLNEFAGKIVEIALASTPSPSNSAFCGELGWDEVRMTYGVEPILLN